MFSNKLITINNPKSPIAEAYRILRTNIHFSVLNKPLKTLLITSAGCGEGKTLTVANLGVAFAQAGEKAVLLDCDFRKPGLHTVFGQSNNKGLVDIILGRLPLDLGLKNVGIDGLKLITTGSVPPNPVELISSNRTKEFISDLAEMFDIVLIDTPPVAPLTDAALMASNMDGVLLVVAQSKSKIAMVQKSKELLLNVNARIIATVLNMTDDPGEDYRYYNYG
ncbi:capsular exopolysaccharide family [Desulfofarcimen acetoxidans DSM 771]|uniref:Capsular exopolysaccharide family n=1 Tax=Desulfofarcimen acetoxidans (strain ATCC 49208 / DSM 771 / KCTC 5769 / VKM B-1644 / 5575) TaxID=485916 RepID=C8W5K2_DESAS|nr:CpsD/CapB family tyrosine-protein kinase [Desulfofarcimen acetoxidans]ACV64002.1 capsular exopolysaccharide family [Desulfofarcimen acetoxidans DSM 771]